MTMLAERNENKALTLADYEARIHLYKEQIGTGYIGIGRTLNEARAAGAVPHGEWEAWVTRVTGLTPRQAQRCMQAAREIREGSAMARLEMSKALMLLSSGLSEESREEVAAQAAREADTATPIDQPTPRMASRGAPMTKCPSRSTGLPSLSYGRPSRWPTAPSEVSSSRSASVQ